MLAVEGLTATACSRRGAEAGRGLSLLSSSKPAHPQTEGKTSAWTSQHGRLLVRKLLIHPTAPPGLSESSAHHSTSHHSIAQRWCPRLHAPGRRACADKITHQQSAPQEIRVQEVCATAAPTVTACPAVKLNSHPRPQNTRCPSKQRQRQNSQWCNLIVRGSHPAPPPTAHAHLRPQPRTAWRSRPLPWLSRRRRRSCSAACLSLAAGP